MHPPPYACVQLKRIPVHTSCSRWVLLRTTELELSDWQRIFVKCTAVSIMTKRCKRHCTSVVPTRSSSPSTFMASCCTCSAHICKCRTRTRIVPLSSACPFFMLLLLSTQLELIRAEDVITGWMPDTAGTYAWACTYAWASMRHGHLLYAPASNISD